VKKPHYQALEDAVKRAEALVKIVKTNKKKLEKANDNIPHDEMMLAEALAAAHAEKLTWTANAALDDNRCCALGALAIAALHKQGRGLPTVGWGPTQRAFMGSIEAMKIAGLKFSQAESVMAGNDSSEENPGDFGFYMDLGIAFRQAFGDRE